MTEIGVVCAVKDKNATVRFKRHAECDSCNVCRVCKDGKEVEISVENKLNANIGDKVEICVYKRLILLFTALAYAIPPVLTAVGYGISTVFNDIARIVLSVCGFIVGMTIALALDRFVIRKHKYFKAVMTAIIEK